MQHTITGTTMPVLQIGLDPNETIIAEPGEFSWMTNSIQLHTTTQTAGARGLFGGNGFIMQRLAGPCTAFVELGGESVVYDLRPGESIQVHPGHVGMFQETVNFDIVMMRGIRNALFGADGLFIARLTGPGKVWLQSMTIPNLAHAISPYLGEQPVQAAQDVTAGAVAGSILNDIFGRR